MNAKRPGRLFGTGPWSSCSILPDPGATLKVVCIPHRPSSSPVLSGIPENENTRRKIEKVQYNNNKKKSTGVFLEHWIHPPTCENENNETQEKYKGRGSFLSVDMSRVLR